MGRKTDYAAECIIGPGRSLPLAPLAQKTTRTRIWTGTIDLLENFGMSLVVAPDENDKELDADQRVRSRAAIGSTSIMRTLRNRSPTTQEKA